MEKTHFKVVPQFIYNFLNFVVQLVSFDNDIIFKNESIFVFTIFHYTGVTHIGTNSTKIEIGYIGSYD